MLSDFTNVYKDMSVDSTYNENGSLHESEMPQIITPDNKNNENKHARQNYSLETCNMEMIYNNCGMQQENVDPNLISNYLNIIFHLNPQKYKNELLLILKDPKKHSISKLLDIIRMLDYKELYCQQSMLGDSLLCKESTIVTENNVELSPESTAAYRISSCISCTLSNSPLVDVENSKYFPLYPVTACSDLHNFEVKTHFDFLKYFSKIIKTEKESRGNLNVTNSNSNTSNELQKHDLSSFLSVNKENACKFIEFKSVNKSSSVEKKNELQHLTNFSLIINDTEFKNKNTKIFEDSTLACSDNLSEIGLNKKNPNLLHEEKNNCQENSFKFDKSMQFENKCKILIEPSKKKNVCSDISKINIKNVVSNAVESINDSTVYTTGLPISISKNSDLCLFNESHNFFSSTSNSTVNCFTPSVPELHVKDGISGKKATINEINFNKRAVEANKDDNMNPAKKYISKVYAQPLLPIVKKRNFIDENENNEYLLLTANEPKGKKVTIESTKILEKKNEVSNGCDNSIIVSMVKKSFEAVNKISEKIHASKGKEEGEKNEGNGQKRQCINKFFTEKSKIPEDSQNSNVAEIKNYVNENKVGQEIEIDETARSHTISSVLGIKGKTEVALGDNQDEKQITLPENPLDRFFCQKYLLGLLHFSRLYGQFFTIHNAAEFTQFLKKKIEIRIKAMLPGMIEAYQYRLDPVYHALIENKDVSCSKLTEANLIAFQYLKPLINFFKLKACDEKIIQEIKRVIYDNRRRRGIGGINRGYKGHKKDVDFVKSNIYALKHEEITDASRFPNIDSFVQDFKDNICNQYNGDTPEGKAKEFADVAHSQRRLMQKLTPLDYRAYLLSNQTARKIFPEKFRMKQLRMIETCHYDLEDKPRKLIGPLILPDALFPNKTNDFCEFVSLHTSPVSTKGKPVSYIFSKTDDNLENTLSNHSDKTQLNKNNLKLKSRNVQANFEENDYLLQTKKRNTGEHNINSSLKCLDIASDASKITYESVKKNSVDSESFSSNNNRNSKSTLNADAIIFLNKTISNICNNSQIFKNIKPIIADRTSVKENNSCTDLSLSDSCKNKLSTFIEMKRKIDSNSNNMFPTPGQSVLDFIMLQDINFVKMNNSKNKLRNAHNATGSGGKSNKKRLRTTMISLNKVNARSFSQKRGKQSGRMSNIALGLSQKTLIASGETSKFPVSLR